MNLYQIDDQTFEFGLYNLLGPLDGHYTFRWKRDGSYQLMKHGGYGNLTSYVPVEEPFRDPTPEEAEFLKPYIEDTVNNAVFFEPWASLNRGPRLVESEKDIVYAYLIFDKRQEFVES